MNTALWAGIAILSALSALCCRRIIMMKREALRLHDQIQAFLNGDIPSPTFSVRDDRFALFENAVIELETRLLQSAENKRAESEKNEAFIQDISHQLKTPIAGLRLYCEMDEAEHREQALKLIERMEMMISSLLRLEKLNADGYSLAFKMCELGELARDAADYFTELYPNKRITVSGEASIRCDAYWISDALNNLIKNACEHTGERGKITVTIEQSDSEAIIKVEDDGGGVKPDALGKLFNRFYRGDKPDSEQGVGLGLAIVKTIVQKHHGSAIARNGERGLVVLFYLPKLHYS
jgi:signal transduction histidine kinase